MGEFANKKRDDVVVFATTPNDTHYSTQNWNAVVLYNYLHKLKCNFEEGKEHYNDTIFDELQKTITQYYEEKYKIDNISEKIKDAIHDIKEYAKELHLYDAMQKFIEYDKLPQEIETGRYITPALLTISVQQIHNERNIYCWGNPKANNYYIKLDFTGSQKYAVGYGLWLITNEGRSTMKYAINCVNDIDHLLDDALDRKLHRNIYVQAEEEMAYIFDGIATIKVD